MEPDHDDHDHGEQTTKKYGPTLDKEYCDSCGKPLGNSAEGTCHDCGGRTYRGGKRITGEQWKILLGVSVAGGD